jgi:hypothetical protein
LIGPVFTVHWQNTITLGAVIIAASGGLAGLAWFAYGVRWQSAWRVASAQTEELRRSLADERTRGDRTEDRLGEATKTISEQRVIIERLEALPNLERVVKLMADTATHQDQAANERLQGALKKLTDEFDTRFTRHEEKAEERHDAQLAALAGIAAVLTKLAERWTPDGRQ